jgi:hypothetical protein
MKREEREWQREKERINEERKRGLMKRERED